MSRDYCYIAGPMTGIPYFNAAAFDAAATRLKKAGFDVVFNPADHGRAIYGEKFFLRHPEGDPKKAATLDGFSLRDALEADLSWICKHATHMYMLKGWEVSRGAKAEHALALALGLSIGYESEDALGEVES